MKKSCFRQIAELVLMEDCKRLKRNTRKGAREETAGGGTPGEKERSRRSRANQQRHAPSPLERSEDECEGQVP
jgi:hypothetical protein